MRSERSPLALRIAAWGVIAFLHVPLALKAGIHCGPCLAINQNERLDYFGTTVNITARLCGLCTGTDIVLSSAVRADPEVAAHLAAPANGLQHAAERTTLKGFGDAAFDVWRIRR